MVTNKTIAERTAKNLVKYLNSKGIRAESDFRYDSIRKVLRECYYVKKIVECGYTECIHIDLPDAGSFIAVLNDGKIMSGMHVMIQDAIYCIYTEYLDDDFPMDLYPTLTRKLYSDGGDCGMFIMDVFRFRRWCDSKFPFSIGMKVRWYDPEKEYRDLSRIYTIFNINGEIISIADDFSEVEVTAEELEIVA